MAFKLSNVKVNLGRHSSRRLTSLSSQGGLGLFLYVSKEDSDKECGLDIVRKGKCRLERRKGIKRQRIETQKMRREEGESDEKRTDRDIVIKKFDSSKRKNSGEETLIADRE